jgi:hypothetical protein
VDAAKRARAAKAMAKAVALLDRVATRWGHPPASLVVQPVESILKACHMEPDGARTTAAGLAAVLAAYRDHHRLPPG